MCYFFALLQVPVLGIHHTYNSYQIHLHSLAHKALNDKKYQTTRLISIISTIIFKIFSGSLSTPTLLNFSSLVLATICRTGIASVRSFYSWFLRLYCGKSLNTYYHTLEVIGEKLSVLELKVLQDLLNLNLFDELSCKSPVLFPIDDTLQPKYGKKFAHVKILHDLALHTGKAYVNTYDFITLGIYFLSKARITWNTSCFLFPCACMCQMTRIS